MPLSRYPFLLLISIFLLSVTSLLPVPLKHPDGVFDFEFPASKVPKSYEQLQNQKFPSNANIELDFSGFPEGATTGPDGGAVYKWKEGTYKWTFKEGGELTFWNPSNWIVTKENHTFHTNGENGNGLPKNFRFTDPNGSSLSQYYHKAFQTNFYFYENFQERWFFQLFPENLFTSRVKKSGRFHFYHEPEHEAWIDAFLEGNAYSRFEDYIEKTGYTTSKQIPVVFFKNASPFRNFINLQNADCAGGRGGIFGISFCSLSPIIGYVGNEKDVREKSKAVHHTHMLYHEWGHHLQQVQCAILRRDQKLPEQQFSAWFNEGMAEYLGYIGSSKKRGNDRMLFFEKYVLPGKEPQLTKEDPYLLGGQTFRYIAENYGEKAVLDIWSKSCLGEKEDVIFRNLTSKSPEQILKAVYKDLSKYKKEAEMPEFMRATLEDWAIDIYSLNFLNEDSELPHLDDPTSRPNLRKAFALDTKSIEGKLEGQFTTPRKEQIYLFKDGTYTIRGATYKATFFQNQTIVYLYDGHEVTEWPKGNLTWKHKDGKVYQF